MVTAHMVKELRQRTGSGMMECKKALIDANGDIELAIEEMRKSGQAKADKKASRIAAEGIIVMQARNGKATAVEINSETDFVARDENFLKFASDVSAAAHNSEAQSIEVLSNETIAESLTLEQARTNLIAKIGENIKVRRMASIKGQTVASYSHGGRIGVIVAMEGGDEQLAKDIAMHIAASNPIVINHEDVPVDVVEKEKEIFTAQAQDSGKPQAVIEKMIVGRINKFLDEQSLVGQPFVKNPSEKVGQLLKTNNAKVTSFVRFSVGEGIEKEEK